MSLLVNFLKHVIPVHVKWRFLFLKLITEFYNGTVPQDRLTSMIRIFLIWVWFGSFYKSRKYCFYHQAVDCFFWSIHLFLSMQNHLFNDLNINYVNKKETLTFIANYTIFIYFPFSVKAISNPFSQNSPIWASTEIYSEILMCVLELPIFCDFLDFCAVFHFLLV